MPNGYVIVIQPHGAVEIEETLDGEPRLGQLQKAVDGYIETPVSFDRLFAAPELVRQLPGDVLRLFNGERSIPCIAYCDEDGKSKNGAQPNGLATQLWVYSLVHNNVLKMDDGGQVWMRDVLVGPVAILIGDKAIKQELEA